MQFRIRLKGPNMETVYSKTRNGNEMKTIIKIDVVTACQRMSGDKGEPQLHITTCKRSRGLSTNASVMLAGFHSLSHAFPADFSKTVCASDARATESAIRALHAQALAGVDSLIAEAVAHYAKT